MAIIDPITATYASASSFTVSSDKASEFVIGVRVQANCGVDGIKYGVVTSNGTTTVTVTLDSGSLTSNLTGVLHGNDVPASLCNHGHTGADDGGIIPGVMMADCSVSFVDGHIPGTGAYTGFKFTETGVAANSGKWIYQVDNSQASLLAVNDAETVFNAVWTADRTGATPTYFTVTPTLIADGGVNTDTINGVDVTSDVVTQSSITSLAKGIISTTTTTYVATTGSDSTGTGLIDAPYASISQALLSIANKLISPGALAIIQVADGTYTVSSSIRIDHPDADKIQILGNTSAETTVAISSINTSGKTITVSGDYRSSILVGDIVGIIGSSTTGLDGAYVVSGVAYSGGNTIVTCSAETIASATVGGGSIVIKPCNRCVLSVGSGVTGFLLTKSMSSIKGFRLNSSGGAGNGISLYNPIQLAAAQQLIFHNFNSGVFLGNKAGVDIYTCTMKGGSYGVFLQGPSSSGAVFTDSIIDGCTVAGILAQNGSFVNAPSAGVNFRGITTTHSPTVNTVGNYNSEIRG